MALEEIGTGHSSLLFSVDRHFVAGAGTTAKQENFSERDNPSFLYIPN
jgi:hypothetical protein